MKNYLLLTVLLICCFLAVKSQNNDPIILTFPPLEAKIINNQLSVEWTSFSEKNIKRYNIEVSRDGKAFTTIGTVLSKAEGGNSASPLNYTFSRSATNLLTGTILFLLPFLRFSNEARRKRTGYLVAVLCLSAASFLGCRKSEVDKTETLYLRVVQVDNTDRAAYSKIVKVK